MVTVSQIAVNLSAQTAQFESGIKKANGFLKDFSKQFGSIGNLAAGFSFGTLINSMTAGMKDFAISGFDAAVAQTALAESLAISQAKLAGLQLAADYAEVSQEDLTSALTKLEKNIGLATLGSGELTEKFQKLGLNANELANMPLEEAMAAIADKIGAVKNKYEQAAMATEVFGKGGQKLMNMIRSGSDDLRQATLEAERFGTAISGLDQTKFAAADDALDRFSARMKGVKNQLASFWGPILGDIADGLGDMYDEIRNAPLLPVWLGGERAVMENRKIHGAKLAPPPQLPVESNFDRGFTDADVAGVFEKTITPAERLATELEKLNRMAMEGAIDLDTYGRRWEQLFDEFGKSPIGETLDKLAEQADALGKSDAQKAFDQFLKAGASNEQLDELLDLLEEIETKTKALELKDFAAGVIEATKTPMEKYIEHTDKLRKALDNKNITQTVFDRAMIQADELLDKSKVIGTQMESVRGEVNLGAAFGSQEAAGRIDAFRRSGSGGADKTLQDMLRENRDQTRLQRDLPKNIAAELRGVIGAADF